MQRFEALVAPSVSSGFGEVWSGDRRLMISMTSASGSEMSFGLKLREGDGVDLAAAADDVDGRRGVAAATKGQMFEFSLLDFVTKI